MQRHICLPLLFLACAATWLTSAPGRLELRQGDHICLIGNTLADRLQHDGWLETLIHTRFPEHNLVFRNLGFSGDELTARLRSSNFGSPDEWLKKTGADVILAFFGFNESFQGQAGLEKFRKDLEKFIQDTLKQDYSGRGPPRLVLFTPIAGEKHADPNFPDPTALNHDLRYYVEAMLEVGTAQGVQVVNLFPLSQQAYARAQTPLTVNGIHLKDDGYRALAPAMFQTLFGEAPPAMDTAAFTKLRGAVNEKNALWFSRYRTVDGYNVYGGRSTLKYHGVMNRDTMQREMEMRDVMTANREQRVWAIARGGDLVVKDDNLPPAIEVQSNKPGKNPDGSHAFLSGEDAIARMKLAQGCRVNLFACEQQFPLLANPVQMAFDTRGRLWVAAWPNYPERTPQSRLGDSLLVFEDTDGDGRADRCTPFLEDLNAPTGFQFYKDGVIVVQSPDVWFVRDTDGDGKADWKERVLSGLDSADTHHTANALALDPGGAIYLSDGVFHRTQIETAWGPVRNNDGAIFRFEPRTGRFETYIAYGFANPHGRVFDRWGNDLVTDATGNQTYFGPAISGRLPYPAKHPGIKQFWTRPSRPCPGTGMLSSRHFPPEFEGNFLNLNVIGFLGIFRVKVSEEGSGLAGETLEHLVQSDDPNFRPAAVEVGPDGAVYFLDWHNPIIGHMQHHLRDPSRDHKHGRIYRITYEGRPLLQPALIAGAPLERLFELLKEPEDNVRIRAKIELGARDTGQVLAVLQRWIDRLDPQAPGHEHHLTEALWVHQWHNVVNASLLRRMLRSPEPRARAAATRVLCYWRDRVPDALALLKVQAGDEFPRVRLEAVRAASFFEGPEAIAVALKSLEDDTDYYLDYVFKETLRALQVSWKDVALPTHPKALGYVLSRLSNQELLQAPATEPVLIERLERKGLELNARSEALTALAALRRSDRVSETIAALQRLDSRGSGAAQASTEVGVLLGASPAEELAKARPALLSLAETGSLAPVRQSAYAALVSADGKPDTIWADTARNNQARATLIDSIVQLIDPAARAGFQPLLAGVLNEPKAPGNVRTAALRALPLMGSDQAEANFRTLAAFLVDGRDRTTAARAVRQLPRQAWCKDHAGPVAEAILGWAKTVPADRRTAQDYVETVQVGLDLASLLPSAEALRLSKSLRELGVSVFVIKAVREQMRYDTTRIVVEAGKPFEVVFENVDMMPHNIVFVLPGARAEVGRQAEKMSPNPDRQGRAYVPNNKKILAASKLLEPGQKETIKLTAPKEPGEYEYVCTYPEHWPVMYGQLLVVPDGEALARANATPPPAQAGAAPHQHHGSYE